MQNIQKNALGIQYSYYYSKTSDKLQGVTLYVVTPGVLRDQNSPKISKKIPDFEETPLI